MAKPKDVSAAEKIAENSYISCYMREFDSKSVYFLYEE
jgi:hypothetical protein